MFPWPGRFRAPSFELPRPSCKMAADESMGTGSVAVEQEEPAAKRRRMLASLAGTTFKFQSVGRGASGHYYPAMDLTIQTDGLVRTSLGPAHGSWSLNFPDELVISFHYSGLGRVKSHRFLKIPNTRGWICVSAEPGWEAVLLPVELDGFQLVE